MTTHTPMQSCATYGIINTQETLNLADTYQLNMVEKVLYKIKYLNNKVFYVYIKKKKLNMHH